MQRCKTRLPFSSTPLRGWRDPAVAQPARLLQARSSGDAALMPDLDDWLTTARHEAAHIVCALELGVSFDDCRIREREGQIVGEIHGPDGDPLLVAICAVAGICGEALDSGVADAEELIFSGCVDTDLETVQAVLGPTAPEILAGLLPVALGILRRQRPLIGPIAKGLLIAPAHRLLYRDCTAIRDLVEHRRRGQTQREMWKIAAVS